MYSKPVDVVKVTCRGGTGPNNEYCDDKGCNKEEDHQAGLQVSPDSCMEVLRILEVAVRDAQSRAWRENQGHGYTAEL